MKQARTLLEYLDRRLGGHAGSGPEYVFHCPACIDRLGNEGSKRKFAINVKRRAGQCFRCEYKFRDIRALFRYLNNGSLTMEERILLRDDPPIVTESVRRTVARMLFHGDESERERKLSRHRLPVGFKHLTEVNTKRMPWKRAHSYLLGRGFTDDDIERFEIGYVPTGRYARYIVFPVKLGGEVVYWTSRYVGEHPRGIKSQNPKKRDGYYSREQVLYNFDGVLGESFVMMVEGPLDTVAAINGLGLLGLKLSPFQITLIDKLVEGGLEELCLALDPGAGKAIDLIRDELVDHVPRVSTLLFDHGDPASRRAELPELVEGRVTGALTLTQRIAARLGSK